MEPIKFRVEGTFNLTGVGYAVLIECLTADYEVEYNKPYLLNNVAGKIFAPMAAKDKQGNPRLHLYSFILKTEADKSKFTEGDIASLTTASTPQ